MFNSVPQECRVSKTKWSELLDRLVSVNRQLQRVSGSFLRIVVVGDENGVVGHGLGSSKILSNYESSRRC
jgi:small subunit ribosomal protein S5